MARVRLAGALALVLLATPAAPPVVRQIDHMMFVGGPSLSRLVPILRDRFELPVVFDGTAQVPPSGGTGIGFGNVTLEIIARTPSAGQPPQEGRLGSLALQAENFRTIPDELRTRQIEHFPPAPQAGWTTIGLRGLGGGVFFIDYRHDMDARRAESARVLAERHGGPLGILGVREVTVVPQDLDAVRPAWLRLLGEPVAGDPNLWNVGNGPAIRLVSPDSALNGQIVVAVKDRRRAAAALRRFGIAFEDTETGSRIQPAVLSGLRLLLTQ